MWLKMHVKNTLHFPILSRDILDFVFHFPQTHPVATSVPNLHTRKTLNISRREEDIKKREKHVLLRFEKPF